MGDITKDDVHRAVQDSMRDVINTINRMRDQVERIDRRTDDLDESQREIRDLSQKIQRLYPQLEAQARNGSELNRMRQDIEDVKLRTQNIERGVQQITTYLQGQHTEEKKDQGFYNG